MTRQRPANRRAALTFDFEHAGLKYTATVGRFPAGRKSNSGADVNARDAAIRAALLTRGRR
jgi:hypothetical protein